MLLRLFKLAVMLVAFTSALAGCAVTRMIDSDVRSFPGTPTVAVPSSFSFDRLPSQMNARNQDALEAMVSAALDKKGLKPGAGEPAYRVQVSFESEVLVREPHPSGYSMSVGVGTGAFHHRDWFGSGALGPFMEPSWFRNAVHLVLRESLTGRVAYETTASFESPWSDAGNLFPAIVDAALEGFPNPVVGPRKVVIELPPGPVNR